MQLGNAAIISAGTGLGEAGIFFDGKQMHPFACEGGHCDFAPRDNLEAELLLHLKEKFIQGSAGHVSYERVLSGPGLRNIYEFLRDTGRGKETQGTGCGHCKRAILQPPFRKRHLLARATCASKR